MTEYDYSPEAVDAYLRKQQQIARWVDKTSTSPWRDPYTPATPAAPLARKLQDEYDDAPHRRRGSVDRRDRPRDREREWPRERERDRDRERERDRPREMRERDREQPEHRSSKPHSKRNRSASHSGPPTTRHNPQRSYTVPPPLPLPPFPQPYQQPANGYTYAPKLISPRNSRHSSHTSSTTRLPQAPSPTSYYPPQQQPPYSAPPVYGAGAMRPPVRSQTTPAYGYYYDAKYPLSSASSPYFHGNPSGYPNMSPPQKNLDWATAPQYPHSMYQPNKPPLLKRLFMSLTGGSYKNSPKKAPRRKRSSSF